jgi:alanyl-tRNA synthetase
MVKLTWSLAWTIRQLKGLKAGDLIKIAAPIFGGGGGGRPNMAQAGGKKSSRFK